MGIEGLAQNPYFYSDQTPETFPANWSVGEFRTKKPFICPFGLALVPYVHYSYLKSNGNTL